MKRIVCLALTAALVTGAAGCAYEEHSQYARSSNGYYTNDYGYSPAKQYRSRTDYYRNYKGIDG